MNNQGELALELVMAKQEVLVSSVVDHFDLLTIFRIQDLNL
jgi:hypothetical protein